MLDPITERQGFQRTLLWAKAVQQANAALITTLTAGFRQQRSASVARLSALPRWASRTLVSVMAPLIVCGAIILWTSSLNLVNVRAMNDLGLVSVLPVGCFIALGGLTLGFCLSIGLAQQPRRPWQLSLHLARQPRRPWLLSLYLLALIYMLYATPTLVEQAPRFQVTYWLAGHTEYVMRTGSVDPYLDAYFNWPGFFVLTALLTNVTGLHSVMAFAPWASFVYNLLYLMPIYLIYTSATRDKRVVWLGMWFFYITDWVWQDYFSPQGLNLFFYLVIIAILLKWFKTTQASPPYLLTRLIALLARIESFLLARIASFQMRPLTFAILSREARRRVRRIATALKDASAHPGETLFLIVTRLNAMRARFAQTWSIRLTAMSARVRSSAVTIVEVCKRPKRLKRLKQTSMRCARWLQSWMALSDTELTPEEYRKRVALLLALIVIFALSIVSHPVTPLFVLLSVGALVYSGQCAPRWLPILMALMILGWDLAVASPYMAGHLSADLAAFGNVKKAASANLTDRLATGSAQHHFIAQVRVVITGAVWGLAILGAVLRWRRAAVWYADDSRRGAKNLFTHDLSYLLLAIMPLFMVIAQPYGGEMAMRSYLLSLPLVAFFAAAAFCTPTSDILTGVLKVEVTPRSFIRPMAMTAAAFLLLTSFMFARYGNERADFITYNEVNAVSYLYSVAPPRSLLLEGWTGTPWRYQDLELYDYSSPYHQTNGANLLRQHNISSIMSAASNERFPETYLIITRSQIMQAEMFNGVPPSAFASVEQQLLASGKFVQVYSNPDAVVLMFIPPAHPPRAKYPNHPYSATPIARGGAR